MNLASFYQSAEIVPPIQCDNPNDGEPSDHYVPVCSPHTNRFTRPPRKYKTIQYRPLPETSILKFGQWITSETWTVVTDKDSSTSQAI